MNRNLISMLQCPGCGGELRSDGFDAVCVSCGKRMPSDGSSLRCIECAASHSSDGKPDALIVRMKNAAKRFPKFYMFLVYVFGVSNAGVSPKTFMKRWITASQIAVNLGAGIQKKFPNAIHVDMIPFPGVDVVADARRLPFAPESADAVICQSMIEHVDDPQAVLSEISRILKPGGHCYLTVPFIFPYHSSPDDYRRLTRDGLRVMCEAHRLPCVDSGMRHGPTSAAALIFAHWLAMVCSFNIGRLYGFFVLAFSFLLMPLSHVFDFLFRYYRTGEHIASGYYYVGRKEERP
jgi:SAM-dependent methyltransferase